MKAPAAALLTVLLGFTSSSAFAIQGCLTDPSNLAERADVIAVGRVTAVRVITMPDCPPLPPPREGLMLQFEYLRCGEIYEYDLEVAVVLRGLAENKLTIRVPVGSLPEFSPCDDRPPTSQMQGLVVVAFLERSEGYLWAIDGADGVHPQIPQLEAGDVSFYRTVAERNPKKRMTAQ